MPYRIYRHPDVEQDLFDIVDLIAEYAGLSVANRKLSEIEQSIIQLSETPHIGSLRHDQSFATQAPGFSHGEVQWITRVPQRT